MELASLANEALGGDFVIVGHSLAGGEAAAAVGVTGLKGYTYNAAGLHPNTVERIGGLSNDDIASLMTTQSVVGEVLTGVQKSGDLLLSGLAGYIGNTIGGPLGGLAAMLAKEAFADVPEALGEMMLLPGTGFNPIERHSMDQVIAGIESQKDQDIKILNDYGDNYNGSQR